MLAKINMKYILVILIFLGLSGCSKIRVTDHNGNPIPNAQVVAISLSMSSDPNITNSNGYASIPWLVQKTESIQISCQGYKSISLRPGQKYPPVVTLELGNDVPRTIPQDVGGTDDRTNIKISH